MSRTFYPLTMGLILLAWCGCSRDNRPEDIPRLYPVTLTIMLDDRPLDNAIVMLYAESGADAQWTVGSQTDTQGQAIIMTHGQFSGAPAGKFKVCVSKSSVDGEGTMLKLTHDVDPLFGDPTTTPLEIEISPKGKATTSLTLNVHKPK